MHRNDSARNRRRMPAVLPGLLLAVGIAAWTGGCSAAENGDAERGREGSPAGAAAPGAGADVDPVRRFTEYAAGLEETPDGKPLEADRIADGLRSLAGALGTLGVERPEVLVDLRVAAEHVVLNPDSPDVAGSVRQALVDAAAELPDAPPPDGPTVRQAAESIQADTPLAMQHTALRTFFRQAAAALTRPS